MEPGDKLVCAFIEPLSIGDTFVAWPLHVTLVPWFRLESGFDDFMAGLHEALNDHTPFTDTVGERDIFSKREANVLHKDVWQPLHETVLACVYNTAEPAARRFRFVADQYQPHVTVQPEAETHEGERISVNHVYVIEQKGNFKEVAGEVSL